MADSAAAAEVEQTTVPPEIDEQEWEAAAQKPCRVGRISLLGLNRTKAGLVERELRRVEHASTLEEIKDELLEAYEDLVGLDIFDAVDVVIDKGDAPDTCSVVAQFQEKNLLRLHTGTYVQGTEGSVEASLNLNNPLGYAEQVTLGCEYGSQNTNVYSLGVSKPRPGGTPALLDLRLHQLFHNYQPWSSYTELLRGGVVTLASEDGRHALSYELGWRRLAAPKRAASRAVLSQLGDSLKSAIKYTFRDDTYDNATYPTSGWGVRSTTEVAGLGAGAGLLRFAKQHVASQVVLPVSGDTVLALGAEAGLLLPWGSPGLSKPSHISERFFLGGIGAGALRGFFQKGVGPTDMRRPTGTAGEASPRGDGRTQDALGGDVALSLLAALRFKLPGEAAKRAGLYGQAFLNGGSLAPLSGGLSGAMHQMATTLRWSMGLGIVWPLPVGRLELNIGRVLTAQANDVKSGTLQFGFAASL